MKLDVESVRSYLLKNHANTVDVWRLDALERDIREVVERVPGDLPFVELGTFKGAGAAWIRAVLDDLGESRDVHVFDSFQGLPDPDAVDGTHLSGGEICSAPSDVLLLHEQFGLRAPIIHAGWFEDSLKELPDCVAWAYVDCDFFASTVTCLDALVPRMHVAGSFIVDDYADVELNPTAWDGLPGVYAACVAFFGRDHPLEVIRGGGDLAFGRWVGAHA